MYLILWLIALVCIIYGIMNLLQRQLLVGLVLIVVGLAIGPGGYSVFH